MTESDPARWLRDDDHPRHRVLARASSLPADWADSHERSGSGGVEAVGAAEGAEVVEADAVARIARWAALAVIWRR